MGESYRDLKVWQRAIQLTVAVYSLTADFPSAEQFGLTNQLRRASVSDARNIAEGYGRSTRGEYLKFLSPMIIPGNRIVDRPHDVPQTNSVRLSLTPWEQRGISLIMWCTTN